MSALSEKIYGAGHANLDRDHEVLLQLVSELKSLPTDSPRLERIGAELLAYMDAHFEDEERLMDRYGYPAAADHKAAHRQAVHDAQLLVRLLAVPGFQIPTLAQPLQDWIETHMCGADVRLAEFLNQHNVAPCVSDIGVFGEAGTPIPETPDGNS